MLRVCLELTVVCLVGDVCPKPEFVALSRAFPTLFFSLDLCCSSSIMHSAR